MKIPDRLYNEIVIDDPIIEALINTKPFQRLKEINQYGGVNIVFPDKYQVSRYQHSLGVYHVLKVIGADLEVQVAGLLHNIGHTAFSHMYDMALATHSENNHEQIMHMLEGWNEVKAILEQHSLKIGNPDEYVLIKKSLPDIGADRFDYALRDYFFATNAEGTLPLELLRNIKTDAEGIYFESADMARKFAETGNKAMWYVIYDPEIVLVYQSLIEMIRLGLNNKWLTTADFMRTDKHVFNVMMQNKDKVPENCIKIFTNKFSVEETTKDKCDFEFVKLKSRHFDPRVKTINGIKKISEVDSEFKASLESYIKMFERAKTGIYYKANFQTKNNFTIVRLTPNDWHEYKNIRLETLRCEPIAFSSTNTEAQEFPDGYWLELLADDMTTFFAARVGNELVGILRLTLDDDEEAEGTAIIGGVYVRKSSRGSGIGRALLESALAEAYTQQQIQKIRLYVKESQGPALKLYAGMGFKKIGIKDDEIIMERIN